MTRAIFWIYLGMFRDYFQLILIQNIIIFIFSISCLIEWNFVRFHEISFQTDAESFSFLSWKTKKFCPYKKILLGCCQYQNKKALFTDPILSEGFGQSHHIQT